MKALRCIFLIAFLAGCSSVNGQSEQAAPYHEPHRPQVHFSPKEKWMNDPNGMVYFNNKYHLFYQYYPDSTVWGPMHWGHAISKDLIHWQQQPVALYPDTLGYIFSGSAVADVHNTAGFGRNGKTALVAIFTHHDPKGEKAGTTTFQNQSIAYSTDDGKTWTKYANNPVLKNPGIKDFRDPKVSWYEAGKKWIMTLATMDRITFYSSKNLKEWTKESEFGKASGAHGGVWECPDLFSLDDNGRKVWVLVVNLNPGGPNGGSATQYFLGDFNGKTFTPTHTDTRWLDYGPDEYAGITWSNTGSRKIFLGWMSNWLYADKVPTVKWRSATTVPRELALKHAGNITYVASQPVKELAAVQSLPVTVQNLKPGKSFNLSAKAGKMTLPCRLDMTMGIANDFAIVLSNGTGEEVVIGYDNNKKQYFIDRTKSGRVDFQKDFAAKHVAPRLAGTNKMDVTLIIDAGSVELFADDGLTVMTEIFFPTTPYNNISIHPSENAFIEKLSYAALHSIWQ